MISTHVYTAALSGTSTPVNVTSGSITLDDSTSPHVTASIDVPMPGTWSEELSMDFSSDGFGEDPFGDGTFGSSIVTPTHRLNTSAIEKYDPRKTLRVTIEATVTTSTYTHSRTFDLGLRDRRINHAQGTISLSLASDEALLQDYAPLYDDNGPAARQTSLRQIVAYVVRKVIPGAQINWTDTYDYSFADTDFDIESLTWKAGQNALTFIVPLVQAAGYRLVCDERRVWTLRGSEYTSDGSLDVQHGVNLIDGTDAISRDAALWFDAMVTRYKWTDPNGVQKERTDSYSLRSAYTRLHTLDKDTPYPGSGFSAYAVRRAQARGRELSATTVADWRARAEMPVTVQLQAAPIQTGRISRLSYNLDNDEMSITARTTTTSPTAWVLLPAGQKWQDSPTGASWIGEA